MKTLSQILVDNNHDLEINQISREITECSIENLKQEFHSINHPIILLIIINILDNHNEDISNYTEHLINILNKAVKVYNQEHLWHLLADMPLSENIKKLLYENRLPDNNKQHMLNMISTQQNLTLYEYKKTLLYDVILDVFALKIEFGRNPFHFININREVFVNFFKKIDFSLVFDSFIENYLDKRMSQPLQPAFNLFLEIFMSANLNLAYEKIQKKMSEDYDFLFKIRNSNYDSKDNLSIRLNRSLIVEDYKIDEMYTKTLVAWLYSFKDILFHHDDYTIKIINQLAELIDNITYEKQLAFINSIKIELLQQIITYVIANLNHSNYSHSESCRSLTSWLSNIHLLDDQKNIDIIYQNFSKEDVNILSNETLKEIAKSILKEKLNKNTRTHTFDGIWIKRLLTEIKFIEHCSPDEYNKLIERYKLISCILKKEEFKTASPDKKKRLLSFRIDEAIREIIEQSKQNIAEAGNETALANINHIMFSNMKDISDGYWNKLQKNFYNKYIINFGEIPKSKYLINLWFQKYSQSNKFFLQELTRKHSYNVYDAAGQHLGIINACNYLLKNESLVLPDENSNNCIELYNQMLYKIGYLSEFGKVVYTNIFHKNLSAKLIEETNFNDLQESSVATDLLVIDVFRENTWSILFDYLKNDDEKKLFIYKRINNILENSENFDHQYMIFRLLDSTDHQNYCLLNTFIEKNKNRIDKILNKIFTDDLFLNEPSHDISLKKIQYILRKIPTKNAGSNLIKAFENIQKENNKKFDKIYQSIFQDSNMLKHILYEWLSFSNDTRNILSGKNKILVSFVLLCNPSLLSDFIAKSNLEENWQNSCGSKFVLLALNKKLDIYLKHEINALNANELCELNSFVARYFLNNVNSDQVPELKNLLKRLLPSLCLQSAGLCIDLSKIKYMSTKYLLHNFGNKDETNFLNLYLLNFKGEQKKLVWLLKFVLADNEQALHPVIIKSVANIMVLLKNKEYADVVCNQVEDIISNNHKLLDQTVFKNILIKKNINDFELIKKWGHEKNYALVIHACEIVKKDIKNSLSIWSKFKSFFIKDKETEQKIKLLKNISKEAKAEIFLEKHKHKWYFGLYKVLTRFVTYFLREPSGYVALYDQIDQSEHLNKMSDVTKEQLRDKLQEKLRKESPTKIFFAEDHNSDSINKSEERNKHNSNIESESLLSSSEL